MKQNHKALEGVKIRAKKMEAYFKAAGIPIKHGQVLEAISASDHYASWNHYSSELERLSEMDLIRNKISFVFKKPNLDSTGVWKMHALTQLNENPDGHVVVFSPYPIEAGDWAPWEERLVPCVISLDDCSSPVEWEVKHKDLLKGVKGKIVIVSPNTILPRDSSVDWLEAACSFLLNLPSKSERLFSCVTEAHRYDEKNLFANTSLFWNFVSVGQWCFFSQFADNALKAIASASVPSSTQIDFMFEFDFLSSHERSFFMDLFKKSEASFSFVFDSSSVIQAKDLDELRGWSQVFGSVNNFDYSEIEVIGSHPMKSTLEFFLSNVRNRLSGVSKVLSQEELIERLVAKDYPGFKVVSLPGKEDVRQEKEGLLSVLKATSNENLELLSKDKLEELWRVFVCIQSSAAMFNNNELLGVLFNVENSLGNYIFSKKNPELLRSTQAIVSKAIKDVTSWWTPALIEQEINVTLMINKWSSPVTLERLYGEKHKTSESNIVGVQIQSLKDKRFQTVIVDLKKKQIIAVSG